MRDGLAGEDKVSRVTVPTAAARMSPFVCGDTSRAAWHSVVGPQLTISVRST